MPQVRIRDEPSGDVARSWECLVVSASSLSCLVPPMDGCGGSKDPIELLEPPASVLECTTRTTHQSDSNSDAWPHDGYHGLGIRPRPDWVATPLEHENVPSLRHVTLCLGSGIPSPQPLHGNAPVYRKLVRVYVVPGSRGRGGGGDTESAAKEFTERVGR